MRDANEGEIVRVLEAAGATVTRLNGTGVPDLLVGFCGITDLQEVKRPEADVRAGGGGGASRPNMGGDGTLTEAQILWWHGNPKGKRPTPGWQGRAPKVVRTPDEALAAINCWLIAGVFRRPSGALVVTEECRPAVASDFPAPVKRRRG